MRFLFLLFLLGACGPADRDDDGFTADADCDDRAANVNPDAVDIRDNGIDEDCDGEDREPAAYWGSWGVDFADASQSPVDGDILLDVRRDNSARFEMSLIGLYDAFGEGSARELADNAFRFSTDLGVIGPQGGTTLSGEVRGDCELADGFLSCVLSMTVEGEPILDDTELPLLPMP
jgi:hypothetical protein